MEVLKKIAEGVFSFGMLVFLIFAGFAFLLYATFTVEYENNQRTRLRTEACYERAMVLVNTDAGQRCVDPRSLVKVK